ncbi:MAG: hypothetical protein OIF50_15560 [Flavobacteriaceae bacterium]|nr:hypothetical protein [Flavobacteriaceae bacterium]
MVGDTQLKTYWEQLEKKLSTQFGDGEILDLDAMIYLVGIQELGQLHRRFKKDEKLNLMHIAICTLLEPYGYYRFDFIDDDGWPHFVSEAPLPNLKPGEQSILMKEALVQYFLKKAYLQ